jgi:small basic protein (TIGR04137 family)
MSIHPSLNLSKKDKKQKSVLKRTERLRTMMEKGQWKEGDNVYGLPKIKTVRLKIKKEKTKELVEASAVEGATPAASETKTKGETAAKGPTTKTQDKK